MNALRKSIIGLYKLLRQETKVKYNRINPFIEDLTDWKERGEFYFGPGLNITVYNSSTISGNVKVGKNTWIGPYTALDGGVNGLSIGEFCSIASGVNILTHDSVKWALSGGICDYEHEPVSIGNCCFIGTNTIITKGVNLGNHCLVGANAVLTRSFPDFSIVLGNPAKLCGKVIIEGSSVRLEYF